MANHHRLPDPRFKRATGIGAVVAENLGGNSLISAIHYNLIVREFPLGVPQHRVACVVVRSVWIAVGYPVVEEFRRDTTVFGLIRVHILE